MEKFYPKVMKVVPRSSAFLGHLKAISFEELNLSVACRNLSLATDSTIFDGMFTDIYFMTASGNIYKISNKIDSALKISNWFMFSKNNPNYVHVFEYDEIQTGIIKLNKSFYYGHHYLTTPVTEIVGLNRDKCYLNISDVPSSEMVKKFEESLSHVLL